MEYIDIYTEFGEKINQKEQKELAHEKGLYHKAVHVWILNNKGELLLQRRNKDKKIYPNMLDVSFAGHISSGETSIDAIKREGKEELGLDIDINNLEYLFSYKAELKFKQIRYQDNEIDEVYLYQKDIDINEFKFMDNEVSQVIYLDFKRVERMWKKKDAQLVDRKIHYDTLFYFLHQICKK